MYLDLFLTFFQIGAVSFGGGYAMIPLIRELVVGKGWLTEEVLLNYIAVSESTPGPIAVNMATFVGTSQGGILGGALATLGVILPSFIIILLISAVLKNLMKLQGVQAFLSGVRPCIVGMILATALGMLFSMMLNLPGNLQIDWRSILLFAILVGVGSVYRHFRKKKMSPILMIILSAGLGILFFGV